jgi:hypothetical protein
VVSARFATPCQNCGRRAFIDGACRVCGYEVTPTKKLEDVRIVYCTKCGCDYAIGVGEVANRCIHDPGTDYVWKRAT